MELCVDTLYLLGIHLTRGKVLHSGTLTVVSVLSLPSHAGLEQFITQATQQCFCLANGLVHVVAVIIISLVACLCTYRMRCISRFHAFRPRWCCCHLQVSDPGGRLVRAQHQTVLLLRGPSL